MEEDDQVSSSYSVPAKRRKCNEISQRKKRKGNQQDDELDLPLIGSEQLDETEYFFSEGLRRVLPYAYTFHVFAKGRWYSKKLMDMLQQEFRSYNTEYYIKAISSGRIKVNNKIASSQYIIQDHDELTHTVHRHEPPVTDQKITIIHDDPDLLVIDKPPSIPVHPSGRFRHNSVVFILAKEYGYTNLHLVHRIDRLTSGLLLLGKNPIVTNKIAEQVRNNLVIKQYLARVHGKFPLEKKDVNQPIKIAVKGRGINCVAPDGKLARTLFQGIGFHEETNTSLVLCRLYTGRTHQIRVHLQWLGFPIMNDPLYNLEKEDKLQKVFDKVNQQRYNSNNITEEPTQSPQPNTLDLSLSPQVPIQSNIPLPTPSPTQTQPLPSTYTSPPTNSAQLPTQNTSPLLNLDQIVNPLPSQELSNLLTTSPALSNPLPSQELSNLLKTSPALSNPLPSQELSLATSPTLSNPLPSQELSNLLTTSPTLSQCVVVGPVVDGYTLSPPNEEVRTTQKTEVELECLDCRAHFVDPLPEEMVQYLHAYSYKNANWSFKSKLPVWSTIFGVDIGQIPDLADDVKDI